MSELVSFVTPVAGLASLGFSTVIWYKLGGLEQKMHELTENFAQITFIGVKGGAADGRKKSGHQD